VKKGCSLYEHPFLRQCIQPALFMNLLFVKRGSTKSIMQATVLNIETKFFVRYTKSLKTKEAYSQGVRV